MDNFFDDLEELEHFPNRDGRFDALQTYIGNIEEFIATTCEQSEIRLLAQSTRELDPVAKAELLTEVDLMRDETKSAFSSTICGSLLVSIYFSYESSITNIFSYFSSRKGYAKYSKFCLNSREDLKTQYNQKPHFLMFAHAYAKDVLKINLFGNQDNFKVINELRAFRNSYVHNGCSIEQLQKGARERVTNGSYQHMFGHSNGVWHAKAAGVSIFLEHTLDAYKHFYRYSEDIAIT